MALGAFAVRRFDAGPADAAAGVLENVRVNHDGLIFRGGRVWSESFANPALHSLTLQRPSHFAWFLVKNHLITLGSDRIARAVWLIDNYSHGNYFHWLVDCLTRLVNAERVFPDDRTIILPRSYERMPYVGFTLKSFPQWRVRWIEPRRVTRVGELAFVPRTPPYFVADGPIYRADLLEEVARRVAGKAGQGREGARRIYFSRSDARRRRAHNEADVVRLLREHGFEIFHSDGVPPWSQVQAGHGAEMVVGVHGAALANMIFMQPGATVIELRGSVVEADPYFYDWYGPLARTMRLEHHALDCELADADDQTNPRDADLVVDLDALREAIR